jgi:HD-GYP domain-containing protein (c-di-GMP phosphodiesterase class II)
MEHVIRECLIALRLAERLDLREPERVTVYYSGLLAWVGCHTDAYEQAKWFGDDLALKHDGYSVDYGRAGSVAAYALRFFGGAGRPLVERARVGLAFLGEGLRPAREMLENHWLATDGLAARLGLGLEVRTCLKHTFERWDGKGPGGVSGKEIPLTSRLIGLADVVEVFHRSGGVEAAEAVAQERSGTQFDPALVTLFCAEAPALLADLDVESSWDRVIAAEPALERMVADTEFEAALEAIADFADLKSPWRIGHSRGVADLAEAAGRDYGLPAADVVTLRRAALMHDLGQLGVSNAIWDKPGSFTQSERERVRFHPYLSERMLAFSQRLVPLGAIAVQHHERLDGSGYPRALAGDAIAPSGRILAAADAYHAMTETRPHRPAHSPQEAASQLRAEVAAGRLDSDAVNAVLRAAGHRVTQRREWPAGLTTREVEVLRLVVFGLTNREIAEKLGISRKTAGNHVDHIYTKIGAANRARAGLFAMRHGLMMDERLTDPA